MRTLYEIRNRATGATYVGQSGNVNERISCHFCDLRNRRHSNKAMQEDWYDWPEPFWEWNILGEYQDSEIDQTETDEITRRMEYGFCYNKTIFPLGQKKMSESSSQKKRAAMLGTRRSKEVRMKTVITKSLRPRTKRETLWITNLGKSNLGRKLTEEHKRKISATGRKHSEETKMKMSAKKKAYWERKKHE